MAANAPRREALLDAAISVIAERGTRGLTFRAVDTDAGTPAGTASNYFASRDEMIAQVFERIGDRLAPDPAEVDRLSQRPPSKDLFDRRAGAELGEHRVCCRRGLQRASGPSRRT